MLHVIKTAGGLSVWQWVAAASAMAFPSADEFDRSRDNAIKNVPVVQLNKAQLATIAPGMTLRQVKAILGARAEVNPRIPPVAYGGSETLIVWRQGREKWIAVIFIPGKDGILRVQPSGTYLGSHGL